ncbi:hypothetical protein J7K42_00930 [bacterium]|nr:hypothetical protein [bacterium]
MKIFIVIVWFLIFTKVLFFWAWLWQLKEYHYGRFRAHFETGAFQKASSSFWWIKFPKFTKKIIAILGFGMLFLGLIVFYIFPLKGIAFYLSLFILLCLSPLISSLIVLVFQIPTVILTTRILKKAAKKREKFKNLLVIGITGSYGKTSTKEFLAKILSKKFKVLKTPQHINAEIGIAKIILNQLNRDHQIFICEIGAYERGKIKEVCQMIKPKIGILTGISEQHLSTFGSLENIIKGKYELIESLPSDGLAIFNGQNKYCRELFEKTKIQKKLVRPEDYEFELTGTKLFPWDIENLALTGACAEYLGLKREEIENTLLELESPIKIKKGIQGLNIVDSTYSANPKSVISHLDYLKKMGGKKVIVMPCLIELGKLAREIHKRIGEKIGKVCDLAIITTGDYFKELKASAQKSGMPEDKILLIEKPEQIFEKIKSFCSSEDIILLESRVPKILVKKLIE